MSYKGVIFDLDGTLVDTLADLAGAMNYGLKQLNEPVHSIEACKRMIGNGTSKFAERALRSDKQHLHDELLKLIRARYIDNCFVNTTLYDGIPKAVEDLQKAGVRLGVVTNKNENAAILIVEHYFGVGTFDAITGVKGDKWVKPDPAGTAKTINLMGLDKSDILFIGDSDVDIATGINAGVKPVGVTWGFRSKEELIAAGADTIIDKADEIIGIVCD